MSWSQGHSPFNKPISECVSARAPTQQNNKETGGGWGHHRIWWVVAFWWHCRKWYLDKLNRTVYKRTNISMGYQTCKTPLLFWLYISYLKLGSSISYFLLWQYSWLWQLEEGRVYFGVQFQVTVHHCGEVKVMGSWSHWSYYIRS